MSEPQSSDLVVIGGGIHGVGVAQAAAAAGYHVVVLEQTDLAAGTSRRSSKLIHGGLRYLENASFSLVRESLRERELLLKLAPTLVRRVPFHIPVYRSTSRRPWLIRSGLGIYALLAGGQRHAWFRRLPPDQWDKLDGLNRKNLQHVFQYWDAQTDDARLTEAVMASAQSLGAQLWCPARFVSGRIQREGCRVHCEYGDEIHQIHTSAIVNAAGPWANLVLGGIEPVQDQVAVENVQGSHLELPGKVERGCYYMEVAEDRRAVFVMPWGERTLLGTTENPFSGDPKKVKPLDREIEYLLNVYRDYFPNRSRQVLDAWAGLRVLPKDDAKAFRRSRETRLPVNQPNKPRLVSVFGGKLTGYRATALKVMNRLRPVLPARTPIASTAELPLSHPAPKSS